MIISSEFGYTHPYSDYSYGHPEFLSRGSIEYFFRSRSSTAFGIKVLGGVSKISAKGRTVENNISDLDYRTDLFFLGTGFTIAREWGYSVAYLSAAVSHLRIDPKDKQGNLLPNNQIRKYGLYHLLYSAELGIRFIINDFWSLNLGIVYNAANTDYLDDVKLNENNDGFISAFIGFSIFHGGDSDTDGDGISDNKDACPDTPSGIAVNSFGCPYDSDKDGVPDYLDKCPGTPKNILITETGCPEDKNENGIPDYIEVQSDLSAMLKTDSIITEIDSSAEFTENPAESAPMDSVIYSPGRLEVNYNFAAEENLRDDIFTDGRHFWLQTAAFKSLKVSKEISDKLFQEGHNVFVIKAYPFNNEEAWYRIRIGIFESLEDVQIYRSKFYKK